MAMTASESIDKKLDELTDWRRELLREIRKLINESGAELAEDWKWNTGVWTKNKVLVCSFGAFKDHVKINFFKGCTIPDPDHQFNNGRDSKFSRSVDYYKGQLINEPAIKALVKAASDQV
jgi:hypothetical protein